MDASIRKLADLVNNKVEDDGDRDMFPIVIIIARRMGRIESTTKFIKDNPDATFDEIARFVTHGMSVEVVDDAEYEAHPEKYKDKIYEDPSE